MNVQSIYKDRRKTKKHKRYKQYASKLSRRHPRLRQLISLIGPIQNEIPLWQSLNDAVLYAVIGQMLSVAAAGTIIQRLLQRFDNSEVVIKWARKTSHIKGPIHGVSYRKRKALKEWADYLDHPDASFKQWRTLPLNEYRRQILGIWGFGPWSADMIAIFHLGRMDIWPESDIGIKRACNVIFGKKEAGRAKILVKGCETVAAIYMWELLNLKLTDKMAR